MAAFGQMFVPHRDLYIESLLLWKGRLGFRQYVSSHKKRFGIKLFMLCDVLTPSTDIAGAISGGHIRGGSNYDSLKSVGMWPGRFLMATTGLGLEAFGESIYRCAMIVADPSARRSLASQSPTSGGCEQGKDCTPPGKITELECSGRRAAA
ncbi:hypothetical protein M9458_052350 [Cirrhinus mrigala]|uniref:PiggyBac transposable element-derived protein domain-containing protein n=1 Tax=Cirrhinus mrigala TaxID=683832 RepID=A0ABD0MRG8_CIRMR